MRHGSADEHEAAENSPFITELMAGRLRPNAYGDLLVRLRSVYETLERTVRAHVADPLVAAVYDPDLERVAAIDADLEDWRPGRAAFESPATDAYVASIEASASRGTLVAHHYVRYLGDLSGGQALARSLTGTYGLAPGVGVRFYEFAVGRLKPYRDNYRARLDAVELPAADVERVVAEVRAAFGLHRAVFAELGQHLDRYAAVS